MSTFRKFLLCIAVFALSCVTLIKVGSVSAEVGVPGSPTSDAGIVPRQVTASDFPNSTNGATCATLANLFGEDGGWGAVNLDDTIGGKQDPPIPISGTLNTTITGGTYLSWSIAPGFKMLAIVMKGGTEANIYNYADTSLTSDSGLASPPNASGNPAGLSHYNFCFARTGGEPQTFEIGGLKFFDVNANGLQDPGDDFELGGFRIRTTFSPALNPPLENDVIRVTSPVDGSWSIAGIPLGTNYLVREDVPNACDAGGNPITGAYWTQTAPASILLTDPFSGPDVRGYQGTIAGNVTGLDFGNRCEKNGRGGNTLGFWSNKNGLALITAADSTALNAFYLRVGNGDDAPTFTFPTSYANKGQFNQWLLGGNATNMAYMLSVQMAATYLNTTHGLDGTALLDVNGEIGNLNDWITEANNSLRDHPVTLSGHAERANQERLKNIFDSVNNNNFKFILVNCNACYPQ